MKELPKKDSHVVSGGVRSPDGLSIPNYPAPGPVGSPPAGGCLPTFDPLKPVEK